MNASTGTQAPAWVPNESQAPACRASKGEAGVSKELQAGLRTQNYAGSAQTVAVSNEPRPEMKFPIAFADPALSPFA
ncbi:hypothetical protein SH528x_003734 [Novipirellula sp. SH528]|uniref:hypothetical protein n=1 Tax=Novipirellula sp. SH528 TaxID=3454466 RepID=UPI003F9FF90C